MTSTSLRKGDIVMQKQASKEMALDAVAAAISRIIRVPANRIKIEKGSFFFEGGNISIRNGEDIMKMELAPQPREDDPEIMYIEFPTPAVFTVEELKRLKYELAKIFQKEGIIWMG